MKKSEFVVIDDFLKKRENGIIENHHVVISTESIYLIKTSTNYGEYVKSLFSGMGEIIGIAGGGIAFLGELASELTGDKLSKLLKSHSKKASEKYVNKVLENLDKIALKNNGITKIQFHDIEEITLKKGYILNGKSFIEINHNGMKIKLYSKSRKEVSELIDILRTKQQKLTLG